MLALRASLSPDPAPDSNAGKRPRPGIEDWLPLQQAACELGLSHETVRRLIRNGKLRHRVVPRPGGFSYLVYLPNSRHSRAFGDAPAAGAPRLTLLAQPPARDPVPEAVAVEQPRRDDLHALELQVKHLSEALARSLRVKQRSLPPGIGDPGQSTTDPYGRYRWLTRKRRWWPF